MECVYHNECANNDKCHRCFGYKFYKPHKEYQRLKPRSDRRKEVKEGMDFENRGTRQYNKAVTSAKQIARRQLNSGAMAHALGDMITEEELTAALAEYKERGSADARGEKQITIKKEWLDKLAWEAEQMGRDFYFLPFSFKGSDKDYVALEYDMLLKYIQFIQILLEKNRLLQMQVES
jgi:hypothetical protein